MLFNPRVIRSHVVRDEIEHQLEAAFFQPFSQPSERRVAAKITMDGVALDREPGAGNVVVGQVGKRLLKFAPPSGILARDRLRVRAGLPDAQQPNPVEALLSEMIESRIGDVVQRRAAAERAR
ncbi:MAG: hypothetical protein FD138_3355 [Planctomycetota bacterium]|nr:MAG: hypothetical protein FD138_3355 [Planctomycetota bacterium]